MSTKRILATDNALILIDFLKSEFGELIFHQSGGCCDGSSPMCFLKSEFKIGYSDVCIGQVDGIDFWMARDQFDYWQHTQLTLDVVPGRGSSFSLEIPYGQRFLIRSRLFTESEARNLEALKFLDNQA